LNRTYLLLATGAGVAYLAVLSARAAASAASSAGNAAVDAVYGGLNAINPVNQENIFYSGVNAVGTKLTGDNAFTLGGWIYDITH